MPRKPALSVVKPGETPLRAKPKTLKQAIEPERSERELLVMMRERLAAEIDSDVPPHTLAPLIRQLREVDKEIRLLDEKRSQESGDDDAPSDEAFDASSI